MGIINRIKLITGLVLITFSIIGCYPIIASIDFLNGTSHSSQSMSQSSNQTSYVRNSTNNRISHSVDVSQTYYPICIGLFAISGALLIASTKVKTE